MHFEAKGTPPPGKNLSWLPPHQSGPVLSPQAALLTSAPLRLVSGLAGLLSLSRFHFVRTFKQSTGLPPHRWLLGYRVAKAKALLLADHAPLGDVASACGFADQCHLTRVFSRHVGESPAAWRRTRKT